MSTNNIFFKIIFPVVALMVILVAIPAFINMNSTTNLVLDQQKSSLQQICFFVGRELSNWFDENQNELRRLSKLNEVKISLGDTFMAKMSHKKTQRTFEKVLKDNNNFRSLILIKADGTVKVSTDPALIGKNMGNERFFQNSALIADAQTEGDHLFFYVKLPVEGKEMKGMLVARLTMEDIVNELFSKVKIGKTGYIIVADKEGSAFHHPNPKNILKLNFISDLEWGQQLIQNQEGFFAYESDGVEKLMSFTRMKNTDWIIMATGYTSDFVGELNSSMLFSGFVSGVFLLFSIVVLFFVIRKSTTAIIKLTDFIKSVKDTNDFALSIELKSGDEVGQAGEALNSFVKSIQVSIKSVSKVMAALADGDLTERIEEELIGDLLSLKTDVNKSLEMLQNLIGEVNLGSSEILSGTSQIASSSQALAQGATEQAASLEQTSSSLAEINSQAKKNAEDSKMAAQLAGETARLADEGSKQMNRLEDSIARIQDANNQVSRIMKVIDEIASQTNLLSLNAAVEAARAGKYGKGFAIVAEEVRNLANRSIEAARNTAEYIENSIKEVDAGVTNSMETKEILNKMSDSINKVNDLSEEVNSGAIEQSNAIQEVDKALEQMNVIVQQNSSISEEAASASEELSAQANRLQNLVNRFRLQHIAAKATLNKKKQDVPIEKNPKNIVQLKTQVEHATWPSKMITLDDDSFGKY